MRVDQLLVTPLSAYDSKSQRIDRMLLGRSREVVTWSFSENVLDDGAGRRLSPERWRSGLDNGILHIYGTPPAWAAVSSIPTVVTMPFPTPPRLPWQKKTIAPTMISPVREILIQEAVEQKFFDHRPSARERTPTHRIGSYGPQRAGVRRMCELTLARLQRFRDDCQWDLLDSFPEPEELSSYDAWVDPGSAPDDFDGGIAEAMVSGCTIVACRNPINVRRLANGRAGYLVPPGDANEMAHALAATLFRDEVARAQREAAAALIAEYRPETRVRALESLYERLQNGHAHNGL